MAIKPAEYRLSPKAREDVEAVWLYSLQTWGANQADHYIDDLMHSFQLLVDNPKLEETAIISVRDTVGIPSCSIRFTIVKRIMELK